MNREEAQFILRAYRPNSEDARDPQFQEALALVRQDPALGHWFAEEQAIDRAFASKIRSQPVPPDLKQQLLLARSTIRRVPWWRRPTWMGLAASLGVLIAVTAVTLSLIQKEDTVHDSKEALSAFRTAMTSAALDMSAHADTWGLDANGYRAWLVEHRGESDFALPPGLAAQGISACKIVSWDQHRVTMLCFKLAGAHVDLFVVDAADLPGISLDLKPTLFADGTMATAAWRRDGKVYLLAGTMPLSDLQALL